MQVGQGRGRGAPQELQQQFQGEMLAACSKVGAGKAGRRIKMTTDHQHYVFSSYILKRMRGRSSNILQLQHFTDYSTVKRGSSREMQRQQTAPTAEGTEELGCVHRRTIQRTLGISAKACLPATGSAAGTPCTKPPSRAHELTFTDRQH